MLKVLIVDDSAVLCSMIRRIMDSDDRFSVVGVAHDGQAAVTKAEVLQPDLITMDIYMPVMDGIQATKEILKESSPAIVAFTTEDAAEVGFKCMEAGALEVIKKPSLVEMTPEYLKQFCDRLVAIAEAHKVTLVNVEPKKPVAAPVVTNSEKCEAVFIGSSTGGPTAVQTVLKGIGKNFPVPIFITQHIDEEFDVQFAKWIEDTTGIEVDLVKSPIIAQKGHAYIAPAGKHMEISRDASGALKASPNDDAPMHFLKPAVDKMFSTAADVAGSGVLAVLLTGMGRDGADGCEQIVAKGGYTIAEDESTCVVFGMPKAAIEKGAAKAVVPLGDIAGYIRAKVLGRT